MAQSPKPVGAVSPDFQASFDRLTAAVGAAATTIGTLRDAVKTNMTTTEVADFQSKMDALSSSLDAAVNPPAPTP